MTDLDMLKPEVIDPMHPMGNSLKKQKPYHVRKYSV